MNNLIHRNFEFTGTNEIKGDDSFNVNIRKRR